jgi:hypothetical protein
MNILVAYDGTREAKEAARLAIKHAKAFNGRVILAYSMVGGPEIPRQEFERRRNSNTRDRDEGKGLPARACTGARNGNRRGYHQTRRGKRPMKSSSAFNASGGRVLFGSTAVHHPECTCGGHGR